jgi:urease accessory protein
VNADPACGATRLHGHLTLGFVAGPHGTALRHAHTAAPLKIVRPFPLAGGGLLVQVLTLGPGMCAGDRHSIDVTVDPGARAVIIMQSASRVLAMDEGDQAALDVKLTVRAGGQLEYYPGLTIPFANSSFIQRITATVDTGGRLGLLESWATGRSSRGECLQFRSLSARTLVSVAGLPAYADAMELVPATHDVAGAGVLEGHRYVASGFWHGVTLDRDEPLVAPPGTLFALGQSGPEQVYLRALAMDGYALSETLQRAVHRIDSAWKQPPVPFRRFTS